MLNSVYSYYHGISISDPVTGVTKCDAPQVSVTVTAENDAGEKFDMLIFGSQLQMKCASWGAAYRYTFIDFDGSVQFAETRPPSDPEGTAACVNRLMLMRLCLCLCLCQMLLSAAILF